MKFSSHIYLLANFSVESLTVTEGKRFRGQLSRRGKIRTPAAPPPTRQPPLVFFIFARISGVPSSTTIILLRAKSSKHISCSRELACDESYCTCNSPSLYLCLLNKSLRFFFPLLLVFSGCRQKHFFFQLGDLYSFFREEG